MGHKKPDGARYRGPDEEGESIGKKVTSYVSLLLLGAIAGAMIVSIGMCMNVRWNARWVRGEAGDQRIREIRDGAIAKVTFGASCGAGAAALLLVANALKERQKKAREQDDEIRRGR